jgi:signal transduction histidine kinase
MAAPTDDDAFLPELARAASFRPIAHDLRSLLAAALSNAEYLRDLHEEGEARDAANETVAEVRLAADVLALLGALSLGRLAQIDLRAVLWVAQRCGAPLRVDPTGPAVEVRAELSALRAFASAVEAVADPGIPIQVRSTAEGLVFSGLDAARVKALRERLRSVPTRVDLVEQDDGAVAVRLHGAAAV